MNLANKSLICLLALQGIIKQVYDKAVLEPHFATLYAVLCAKLSEQCPTFEDSDGKPQVKIKTITSLTHPLSKQYQILIFILIQQNSPSNVFS